MAKVVVDCVTAGVTGLVPVTVYVTLAAGAGAVTTMVPVGVKQSGWAVTLAVGATGGTGTALMVKLVGNETQPVEVLVVVTA